MEICSDIFSKNVLLLLATVMYLGSLMLFSILIIFSKLPKIDAVVDENSFRVILYPFRNCVLQNV